MKRYDFKKLKENLDDMYERDEWNPEWLAEIGNALEAVGKHLLDKDDKIDKIIVEHEVNANFIGGNYLRLINNLKALRK